MVYYEHSDGRVCIVFPYLGRVLAGSTDLRVDKASRTACSPEERDYILTSLAGLFPKVAITPDQIVYSYAGIRPLPFSKADFTGRMSRGHAVRRLAGNVPQIGMVGGKWTTYRAFAEETVDLVLQNLGLPRQQSTRDLPIGGGRGFSAVTAQGLNLPAPRQAHLVDLYGALAPTVAAFSAAVPDDPLPGVLMTKGEVLWFIRHEQALHLADVLQRRSPLAIRGELSLPLIHATAHVMAQELGWTDAQTQTEITRFVSDLETYHGVRLAPTKGAAS
jgi:glycerol-3-phosphate dehydrogenase